jgi:hypothetical protein
MKFFWAISWVMWFRFCRYQRFKDDLCLHPQGRWVDVGMVDNPLLYLYLLRPCSQGCFQLSVSDRRNQAYSAHHQPESWKRPWEQGLDRYKYRTGLSTIPTSTQWPWGWRQRSSSKHWYLQKQNHITWLTAQKNFITSIESYSLGKHQTVSSRI